MRLHLFDFTTFLPDDNDDIDDDDAARTSFTHNDTNNTNTTIFDNEDNNDSLIDDGGGDANKLLSLISIFLRYPRVIFELGAFFRIFRDVVGRFYFVESLFVFLLSLEIYYNTATTVIGCVTPPPYEHFSLSFWLVV